MAQIDLKWPKMTRNGKIAFLRFKKRKNPMKLQKCSVQKREIHSTKWPKQPKIAKFKKKKKFRETAHCTKP